MSSDELRAERAKDVPADPVAYLSDDASLFIGPAIRMLSEFVIARAATWPATINLKPIPLRQPGPDDGW